MTCDNKKEATKKIELKNSQELDQRWAEETAKAKIAKEGCIRVAITEDGGTMVSLSITDEKMFLAVINAMNEANPKAFEAVAAALSAKNFVTEFSNFLKDLAESSENDAEDTPELK